MDLTDRIAIVTGAGRGIGRGIALVLARQGAAVAVADRDPDGARQVAGEIEALTRRAVPITVDVTDQASVDSMADRVLDEYGRIDILVNNAGIIGAPGWEERPRADDSDWTAIHEVNVKGVSRVTDAVTPGMRERRYGKIVNIASVAGRQGTPFNMAYAASKAAVISLTQASALELAPYEINVNAICPGLLWTPMWERITRRRRATQKGAEGRTPRELFDEAVRGSVPLGREQTPEDIGNLAAFLASDYASNITGQAINVSGGSHFS